jgi:hypothetical protein
MSFQEVDKYLNNRYSDKNPNCSQSNQCVIYFDQVCKRLQRVQYFSWLASFGAARWFGEDFFGRRGWELKLDS